MLPKFFDIHAHVNDPRFSDDRDDMIARMKVHELFVIDVGTSVKNSEEVVAAAEKVEKGIYASIGVHPIDDLMAKFNKEIFAKLADSSRVVAVGECGLDYSQIKDALDIEVEKARQKALFEEHVDFAIERNLPIMIHCRDSEKKLADAHRDILNLFEEKKKEAGNRLHGNVHFFSQTIEIAREFIALGFTISFTGVITFTHEYDEVIRLAPLESIMSETDAPYVAPAPYRGKRNEPIYVEEVVKRIAEIRNQDFETIRTALVQNALRTFNIKP